MLVPRCFARLDIKRASCLDHPQLQLVHDELMRMERAILGIAVIGLTGLQSDRVVISQRRHQSIDLIRRQNKRVNMPINHVGGSVEVVGRITGILSFRRIEQNHQS
jgi:hypothetical protein